MSTIINIKNYLIDNDRDLIFIDEAKEIFNFDKLDKNELIKNNLNITFIKLKTLNTTKAAIIRIDKPEHVESLKIDLKDQQAKKILKVLEEYEAKASSFIMLANELAALTKINKNKFKQYFNNPILSKYEYKKYKKRDENRDKIAIFKKY